MERRNRNEKSFFSFGALGLLLFGISGCTISSVATDVRDVDAFLAAQGQRTEMRVSMPNEDTWDKNDDVLAGLIGKPLTADAAVRAALVSNRDLRASMYELGIAHGRLVQAGLPPNPELDIGIRAPKNASQPMQLDIGIKYDVSELIVLPLKRGAAEADLTAERVRVAGRSSILLTMRALGAV